MAVDKVLIFKATMICIIFCSGLFGVLSPRLFRPYGSKLSYASLFSSGILLSAAIVHLLGDASEALSESPLPDFPWAYFFCGLSFYLLYFFERWFIHFLVHTNSHSGHKEPLILVEYDINHMSSFGAGIDDRSSIFQDPIFDDHGEDILRLMKHKNSVAGFVLLIGLGLHSFLAGVGLGSSNNLEQAVPLGIAITSHKFLAAFTLGCPFYNSGVACKQQFIIALCFSIITPIGIGIGWILSNGLESWISDVFISIAAGTFIYVAIIEILVPEFSELKQKEKLIMKTDRKLKNMHLEDKGVGKRTMFGIEEKVRNEVETNEQRRERRIELTKGISVLSGFLLMSMLALWV
eukprot:162192_1